MKPQTLTIDSEVMEDFREKFNQTIAVLLRSMRNRQLREGTITAKLDIEIEESADVNGEVIRMVNIVPEINMKMGAKAKVECAKKNGLFMQVNEEGVPVVGSCQMDIDELLEKESKE